jgi:hypothetical protein
MGANGNGHEAVSVFRTTDIAMTAFYMLHGVELIDVQQNATAMNLDTFDFVLRGPEALVHDIQIQWANSPEHRYDSQVRMLRKIVAEKRKAARPRKRRRRRRSYDREQDQRR